jgi:hypothetical protein
LGHFDNELIELINLNSELSQSGMLPEVTEYYRRHKIWLRDHRSQPVIGVVNELNSGKLLCEGFALVAAGG